MWQIKERKKNMQMIKENNKIDWIEISLSNDYREVTAGMTLSYSKKAYPWDNACIESFHALLKREWLNRFKITDYNHAYRLVFEYIEVFYNTVRIHSHCEYISPNEYEKNYCKKLKHLEIEVA